MVEKLTPLKAKIPCLSVPRRDDHVYKTERWKQLSQHLRRLHPVCQRCSNDLADHVHHIVPINVAPALAFELSNLQTICRRCHQAIHQNT